MADLACFQHLMSGIAFDLLTNADHASSHCSCVLNSDMSEPGGQRTIIPLLPSACSWNSHPLTRLQLRSAQTGEDRGASAQQRSTCLTVELFRDWDEVVCFEDCVLCAVSYAKSSQLTLKGSIAQKPCRYLIRTKCLVV